MVALRKMRTRWIGSWLGVVALLIQVLVPLGQGLAMPAGGGSGDDAASTASPFLVICTAYGVRTVPAGNGGDGGDGGIPAGTSDHCPVCLSYSAGTGLVAVDAAALPLPGAGVRTVFVSRPSGRPASRPTAVHGARAPPVSA